MKRFLALALAFALTAGLATCAAAQAEPVAITYAGVDSWYSAVSMADDLPAWKLVEEKLNIRIKWEVQPSNTYTAFMQTRLAANQDLPDFMYIPNGDVVYYANEGLLLPMNDLIEQYAPNVKTMLEQDPDLKSALVAPDGNIYHVAELFTGANEVVFRSLIIRRDWLNKLSLELPVTKEDWYDVLKAFKEQDPNGNGKADEIPMTVAYLSSYYLFASAFGLPAGVGDFEAVDGKAVYLYTRPEYKELLGWLSQLYREGLIDPLLTTGNDEAKLSAEMSKDIIGTTVHNLPIAYVYENLLKDAGIAGADVWGLESPVGPDGTVRHIRRSPTGAKFGILADCEHPEKVMELIDYVWASPEGTILMNFGIEGQSYFINDKGEPEFTDWAKHHPDGLSTTNAIRTLGGRGPLLDNQLEVMAKQNYDAKSLEAIQLIAPNLVNPYPQLLGTAEEVERIASITADMKTYIDEMVVKFIMGQESMDQYDRFVQKLYDMGLQEYLDICQAQYDRAMQ